MQVGQANGSGSGRTATERVRMALHLAITSGSLRPGTRLRESEIADRYRVSRTPVREAIRHLAAEGTVAVAPHVGAQVASTSVAEIDELFEIRGALEVLAVARAAARVRAADVKRLRAQLARCEAAVARGDVGRQAAENQRLHGLLYEIAASPQLVQLIASLSDRLRQYRVASLSRPDRPREALQEHRALVAAIARRDVDRTRELVARHADNARTAATRWYLEQTRVGRRRDEGGDR